MKLLLSIFLIAIAINAVASEDKEVDKSKCSDGSFFDQCVQELFIFDGEKRGIPTSLAEIQGFCGRIKGAYSCAKMYIRTCMKTFYQRASEMALSGVVRLAKSMCRNAAKQEELMRHAACGNAIIPDVRICLNTYKQYLYAAVRAESGTRLPIVCCKYYDFRDCARGVLNDADNSICPDDSKAYYTRISQSVQSDVLESVCSTVDAEENSAKCNELKIDVSGTEEEAKHKSVLAPIREILSKMFNKEQ